MWRRAGHNCHCSARLDLYRGALPPARRCRRRGTESANLAVRRNADAKQAACGFRLLLLLPELVVIDEIQGLLERRCIIAAVIAQSGSCLVREFVVADEI